MDLSTLTPVKIVGLLDKHVHGQVQAKEALALAIRNRWRRLQLPPEIRDKVKKQNILLKGPTGSGKTALVRAIQKELGWPVHFVDITQYTETGYKGKDLDEIISNFVEAYADKPLPKWYLDESAKAPVKKPVSQDKASTSGRQLKDYESDDLLDLVCRAIWLYACMTVCPIPYPSDNPIMGEYRKPFTTWVGEKLGYEEDFITKTVTIIAMYRCACLAHPELEDKTTVTKEDVAALKDALDPIFGDGLPVLTDEAMEVLSSDVGEKVTGFGHYTVMVSSVLQSRLNYYTVTGHYLKPIIDEMWDNRATYTVYWLWASAMYDELVRQGAWREVSGAQRIDRKRLNPKARKVISELYGFSKTLVDSFSTLGDVYLATLEPKLRSGKENLTPSETTLELVSKVLSRRCSSRNWTSISPHKCTVTLAISPLVGAPLEVPSEERIGNHDRRLRKFFKECGVTEKQSSTSSSLWSAYLKLFESAIEQLSKLPNQHRQSFVAKKGRPKPRRSWNEFVNEDAIDSIYLNNPDLAAMMGIDVSGGTVKKSDPIKFIQDYGICFLDEFDKLGVNDASSMVSRDGVQRGLLALVEGADYPIKSKDKFSEHVEYTFDTSNLMFVAAGAFSVTPIDAIIPELRGRFPVVASILPLTKENYVSILKLESSQAYYMSELIKVEGVAVNIDEGGYEAMAEVCRLMNVSVNLGARRLDSVIERVFHEAMMSPDKFATTGFNVTKEYVYSLDWSATDLVIKFENPDDKESEAEKAT